MHFLVLALPSPLLMLCECYEDEDAVSFNKQTVQTASVTEQCVIVSDRIEADKSLSQEYLKMIFRNDSSEDLTPPMHAN